MAIYKKKIECNLTFVDAEPRVSPIFFSLYKQNTGVILQTKHHGNSTNKTRLKFYVR